MQLVDCRRVRRNPFVHRAQIATDTAINGTRSDQRQADLSQHVKAHD